MVCLPRKGPWAACGSGSIENTLFRFWHGCCKVGKYAKHRALEGRRMKRKLKTVEIFEQADTTEPAGFSGTTFDICRAVMLGSLQQYWSPAALKGNHYWKANNSAHERKVEVWSRKWTHWPCQTLCCTGM